VYKTFFGLKEAPFSVNPDPRYLFLTRHIQEALACLTYGISERKGFILLTGEVGTGKTTILNRLLDWLHGQRIATSFIFNPQFTVPEFFNFMMNDFGLPSGVEMKSQILIRLNQWLLERYEANERAVLIVDEAQTVSPQLLEEIRLLTNLETPREKLLQIVLAGQPELEENLDQPQLRQLRQRITIRAKTRPLDSDETRRYITERLRIAGSDQGDIFTPESIESIHEYARGIPRVINVLCEHALISSFVEQRNPIPREIVDEVAADFRLHRVEQTFQQMPLTDTSRVSDASVIPITSFDILKTDVFENVKPS
jgi:general secretion pathway protein A